jgi:hypothetical protein
MRRVTPSQGGMRAAGSPARVAGAAERICRQLRHVCCRLAGARASARCGGTGGERVGRMAADAVGERRRRRRRLRGDAARVRRGGCPGARAAATQWEAACSRQLVRRPGQMGAARVHRRLGSGHQPRTRAQAGSGSERRSGPRARKRGPRRSRVACAGASGRLQHRPSSAKGRCAGACVSGCIKRELLQQRVCVCCCGELGRGARGWCTGGWPERRDGESGMAVG